MAPALEAKSNHDKLMVANCEPVTGHRPRFTEA